MIHVDSVFEQLPPGEWQTTLAETASFKGLGIHSGRECRLTICPGEPNFGVRFYRTDLPGSPEIPADLKCLAQEPQLRQTILCCNGDAQVSVQTIEHVLATLHGLGIDNARIEMTGPEPPIWDGSAALLARKLAERKPVVQAGNPRRVFRIDRVVSFNPPMMPGVEYTVYPSDSLTITYFLNYDHPFIGAQSVSFRIEPELFVRDIAPARTFCTSEEVEKLRTMGLIKGGNIDNAIVVGPKGPLNTQLLWPDELARHKLLDLLGDLYLLGAPLRGHVMAHRAGHPSNALFVDYLRKEFS